MKLLKFPGGGIRAGKLLKPPCGGIGEKTGKVCPGGGMAGNLVKPPCGGIGEKTGGGMKFPGGEIGGKVKVGRCPTKVKS
jgi:hypothetical protein